MPLINNFGSPSARIWIICEAPLSTDIQRGYLFSGGMGFVFRKMLEDAGILDYFITCRRPDTDDSHSFRIVENDINNYKPPLIATLGSAGEYFCSTLKKEKSQKSYKTQLGKYVGSLLQADHNMISHPHHIMPLFEPEKYIQDWTERNITAFFDLQKLREELNFWKKHGVIQPLPFRDLKYKDMDLDEILGYMNRLARAKLLSVDIETCYPKGDSLFKPHPGYPVTIGIADSPSFGISIDLFRQDNKETLILWRALNELLSTVPNLGQNYFNFDSHYLRALGFNIDIKKIQDTMIRHHVLWPELPHKLQFQTRQYTREPYYKDEGHAWNLKNMQKLRRYNALDVTVTMEIYMQQEEEFAERKEVA
jgi:uracil-DNA glycosylase